MSTRIKIRAMTLVWLGFCLPSLLKAQEDKPFGEIARSRNGDTNSTLNMHHLPEGEFAVGKDQWGEIVRVNMLKIKDWSKVPGVKKAWVMKGFEGKEGMAFHPVISEIKDVDGDPRQECAGTEVSAMGFLPRLSSGHLLARHMSWHLT